MQRGVSQLSDIKVELLDDQDREQYQDYIIEDDDDNLTM